MKFYKYLVFRTGKFFIWTAKNDDADVKTWAAISSFQVYYLAFFSSLFIRNILNIDLPINLHFKLFFITICIIIFGINYFLFRKLNGFDLFISNYILPEKHLLFYQVGTCLFYLGIAVSLFIYWTLT